MDGYKCRLSLEEVKALKNRVREIKEISKKYLKELEDIKNLIEERDNSE